MSLEEYLQQYMPYTAGPVTPVKGISAAGNIEDALVSKNTVPSDMAGVPIVNLPAQGAAGVTSDAFEDKNHLYGERPMQAFQRTEPVPPPQGDAIDQEIQASTTPDFGAPGQVMQSVGGAPAAGANIGNQAALAGTLQGADMIGQGLLTEAQGKTALSQENDVALARQADLLAVQKNRAEYEYNVRKRAADQKAAELDEKIKELDTNVHPERLFKSKSAEQQLGFAVAAIMGGFLQGFTNADTNPAIQAVENYIDKDIANQKAEFEMKRVKLGMEAAAADREQGKLTSDWHDLKTLQLQYFANELNRAANREKIPEAKANLLKAAGQLQMLVGSRVAQATSNAAASANVATGKAPGELLEENAKQGVVNMGGGRFYYVPDKSALDGEKGLRAKANSFKDMRDIVVQINALQAGLGPLAKLSQDERSARLGVLFNQLKIKFNAGSGLGAWDNGTKPLVEEITGDKANWFTQNTRAKLAEVLRSAGQQTQNQLETAGGNPVAPLEKRDANGRLLDRSYMYMDNGQTSNVPTQRPRAIRKAQ